MDTTTAATTTTTSAVTVEAAAAAPTTLSGILATAIASVRSRTTVAADLTAAKAQLATVTTERDAARSELATAITARDAATAQLNAVAGLFGVKSEELAGKDAKAASELFAKKISDATIEQVAGLGFPVDQLPKQATTEDANQKTLTRAEFKALSEEGKMKFARNGGRISD